MTSAPLHTPSAARDAAPADTASPEVEALRPRSASGHLAGLPFTKGHGTGNDFVLVADPDDAVAIDAADVAFLCDRHRGIGADGLIRAVPSRFIPEGRAVLEVEPAADWFMDYRNSDGSIAEMCGNGVRVFVHFLLAQGLVELPEGASLPIGTRAGLKHVRRIPGGYAVDMGAWTLSREVDATARGIDSMVEADGLGPARPALSISMGNPHTVVALAEEQELEHLPLIAAPVVDPVPENGTNVEFVVPAEPLVEDGAGRIRMRVFERGVGETQSCGTGACAAAAAIRWWAGAGAPADWQVQVPGGVVRVRFMPDADGTEHVELSGPAALVAGGQVIAEAAGL